MPGCVDVGFEGIRAIALKAAINGSTLAVPDACLVMLMALPRGSTRALPTAHDIKAWPPWRKVLSASFRSAVLIALESFRPWVIPAVCAIVFAPLVRDSNAGRQTLRPLWGSRLDTADQRLLKTMPSMQRGR